MAVNSQVSQTENGGSPSRLKRWLKNLGFLALAVLVIFGGLFITGKLLIGSL
jgi:hypothetical protein